MINVLFVRSQVLYTDTLQKKEVWAQLFDLEKRFKIFYVYVERKPKKEFQVLFRATLSFTYMNETLHRSQTSYC